jgi:hypothetical protein
MTNKQLAAIRQLEASLLGIKRAGLAMVGIDDSLLITVKDSALQSEMDARSGCEAILERNNTGHEDTETVNHYGVYLDSGGA